MDKTYEELIKIDIYKQLATLLVNDKKCRTDNWYCIKRFYKTFYNTTIDKAICSKDFIQPSTVERKIRRLKAVNKSLRENDKQYLEESNYKEIGLEIPVSVKLI